MRELIARPCTLAEPPGADNPPPSADLQPRAVKIARRMQALPSGRVYGIILVKGTDHDTLAIVSEGKVETIR